jgi:hypothetical protein
MNGCAYGTVSGIPFGTRESSARYRAFRWEHHLRRQALRAYSLAVLRPVAIALILFALVGCGTNGTAQGGASDNGARGHVKIGLPF